MKSKTCLFKMILSFTIFSSFVVFGQMSNTSFYTEKRATIPQLVEQVRANPASADLLLEDFLTTNPASADLAVQTLFRDPIVGDSVKIISQDLFEVVGRVAPTQTLQTANVIISEDPIAAEDIISSVMVNTPYLAEELAKIIANKAPDAGLYMLEETATSSEGKIFLTQVAEILIDHEPSLTQTIYKMVETYQPESAENIVNKVLEDESLGNKEVYETLPNYIALDPKSFSRKIQEARPNAIDSFFDLMSSNPATEAAIPEALGEAIRNNPDKASNLMKSAVQASKDVATEAMEYAFRAAQNNFSISEELEELAMEILENEPSILGGENPLTLIKKIKLDAQTKDPLDYSSASNAIEETLELLEEDIELAGIIVKETISENPELAAEIIAELFSQEGQLGEDLQLMISDVISGALDASPDQGAEILQAVFENITYPDEIISLVTTQRPDLIEDLTQNIAEYAPEYVDILVIEVAKQTPELLTDVTESLMDNENTQALNQEIAKVVLEQEPSVAMDIMDNIAQDESVFNKEVFEIFKEEIAINPETAGFILQENRDAADQFINLMSQDDVTAAAIPELARGMVKSNPDQATKILAGAANASPEQTEDIIKEVIKGGGGDPEFVKEIKGEAQKALKDVGLDPKSFEKLAKDANQKLAQEKAAKESQDGKKPDGKKPDGPKNKDGNKPDGQKPDGFDGFDKIKAENPNDSEENQDKIEYDKIPPFQRPNRPGQGPIR